MEAKSKQLQQQQLIFIYRPKQLVTLVHQVIHNPHIELSAPTVY